MAIPRRRRLLAGAVTIVGALLVTGSVAASAAPAPAPAPPVPGAIDVRGLHPMRACPDVAPGGASCHAEVLANDLGLPAITPGPRPGSYGPADLRSAYGLPATSSSRPTVAVVDAQDDPNAEADLAVYRATYGLPACTTANGCFRKVDQNGGTRYPTADVGWGQEISLDLDVVSATCPGCRILLVEASSASYDNLGTAVNRAATLRANAISNSYGGPEASYETYYDSRYYNHPGIAITASTGDSGYGAQYPAASPYVTAVGGTSLLRMPLAARGWTETAWSGAGSGCSAYEAKPRWQTDTGCRRRAAADVAAVADPLTGVAVYDSYGAGVTGGWLVVGGTSASAPLIASVYALAGNASAVSYGSYPYAHRTTLNDVTAGTNGVCTPLYLCTAGVGYDGPTGLGTPRGTGGF